MWLVRPGSWGKFRQAISFPGSIRLALKPRWVCDLYSRSRLPVADGLYFLFSRATRWLRHCLRALFCPSRSSRLLRPETFASAFRHLPLLQDHVTILPLSPLFQFLHYSNSPLFQFLHYSHISVLISLLSLLCSDFTSHFSFLKISPLSLFLFFLLISLLITSPASIRHLDR